MLCNGFGLRSTCFAERTPWSLACEGRVWFAESSTSNDAYRCIVMAQVSLACIPRITMRAPKMHCSIRRGIQAQPCTLGTCLRYLRYCRGWAGNVCEAPSCPICGIQRMIPVEAEYRQIITRRFHSAGPTHQLCWHHDQFMASYLLFMLPLSSDPYRYEWYFLNSLLHFTHSRASLTWCSLAICIRRPPVPVTIASAGSRVVTIATGVPDCKPS